MSKGLQFPGPPPMPKKPKKSAMQEACDIVTEEFGKTCERFKKERNEEWEEIMGTKKKIGVAAVDSGQLLIIDPCYLETELTDIDSLNDVSEQLNFKKGHAGLGIKLDTFGGDGVYDVIGHYRDDILTSVEIDFGWDQDDEIAEGEEIMKSDKTEEKVLPKSGKIIPELSFMKRMENIEARLDALENLIYSIGDGDIMLYSVSETGREMIKSLSEPAKEEAIPESLEEECKL